MSTRSFVHLHCHTHYSLLDGANRIDQLVGKVKAAGMNALAITDHGNLYGALDFYSAAKEAGINPILGYEAYIAPGHRTHKDAARMKEASYHLTLLAKNRTGFKNLIKLASAAFLEGFYYKPRIDKELLEQYHEGIICLSGCAAGELSNQLLADQIDEAEKTVAWYHKLFGDDYYLEIQNAGFEIQKRCAEGTIDLAKRMGIPLVATNDAHYLNREDASAHDVLLCVNTHTVRSDPKRMKMEGDQLFVRTPDEMYEAFPGFEDAVARTQEIANQVDIDLDLKTRHFPVFAPPAGKTDADYLRELCLAGITWRYGDNPAAAVMERLEYELDVITRMGFSSYFLIVWDFARFARENGIPALARGSACGAIVAYLLGLSNVCPLQYDLLFERFLDPSRAEAPDIDIDFCRDRREKVLEYVKQKYGTANVAQIGTFGTLGAKAVIRDVARALGVELSRADEVAKFIPTGPNVELAEALKEIPDLKLAYDQDPAIREVIDFGLKLEGLAKSAGTHAAGVVIADQPLTNYVPLQKISGKDDIITQWPMADVEKAGLLKIDFLGLRNLTILDKAVQNVKKHRGIAVDPQTFPLDDRETFALLQRGETKGIFQFESGGIRDLLTKMRPDSFNDIIATSALYRPGPLEGGMVMTYVNVKNKVEPVPKLHEVVDEILAETYGVMVYQEQVMRILNRLGGIELSKAYACIKAISKKKAETIEKNRLEFVNGAQQRGMSQAEAQNLFGMIEKFAGYGFNKSHSTAYAAIAYQTAYLKAHYPVEFMAALLSCGMEDTDRIAEHVDDCRRMKLKVLPPDVNRSEVEFGVAPVPAPAQASGGRQPPVSSPPVSTSSTSQITFGMAAIKGVGEQAVAALVREREANGPFRDLFDLCERVDPRQLTKGVLEILIKAGALDGFRPDRNHHLALVERAIQNAASKFRDKQAGQKNLFGGEEAKEPQKPISIAMPDVSPMTHSQKLASEKEVFGFYLTSHPLSEYADKLQLYSTHSIPDLQSLSDGAEVRLGGMISAIKRTNTKKPSRNGHTRYANFDFEGVQGSVRCIMWPEDFAKVGEQVKADAVCFLEAKVDRRGREPNLIVHSLISLDEADKRFTDQVAIKFQRGLHSEGDIDRVRALLGRYPGRCGVAVVVESFDEQNPQVKLRYLLSPSQNLKVAADSRLAAELQQILGPGNVRFLSTPKRKSSGNGAIGHRRRPSPASSEM
ncbi:MAG: DNA polymerase III subunit alpha [Planctomycetaceae bacterium]|nr:DNA polymerase III subunit alpha [Planctomycetaceae bacterium]